VRNVLVTEDENLLMGRGTESATSTLCPAALIKRDR
jgi:hypothetical protein